MGENEAGEAQSPPDPEPRTLSCSRPAEQAWPPPVQPASSRVSCGCWWLPRDLQGLIEPGGGQRRGRARSPALDLGPSSRLRLAARRLSWAGVNKAPPRAPDVGCSLEASASLRNRGAWLPGLAARPAGSAAPSARSASSWPVPSVSSLLPPEPHLSSSQVHAQSQGSRPLVSAHARLFHPRSDSLIHIQWLLENL